MISRRLSSNGFRRLFLFKSSSKHSTTATTAAGTGQPHKSNIFVDYLMNSIDFSKEEAFSAAAKVSNCTFSRNDPDSVVNFLLKLGLNKTQIKSIISSDPRLLSYNSEKIFEPKIQVLRDIGMSASDIIKLLVNFKPFLRSGLNSQILPSIQYLRNLLGTDEKVAKAINKYAAPLFARNLLKENVELLHKVGFSRENVSSFVIHNPRCVISKTEWLEEVACRVENDIGISPESKMFYHGVMAVSKLSKSKFEMKLGVLRSFGWSDPTIYSTIRKFPYMLGTSVDKINATWKFFTEELGYAPDYLATHPTIFNLNFERRVKPRIEVLKILDEKKLNKRKTGPYTVLCMAEEKFVKEYLLPYKDDLPDMCGTYLKNVEKKEDRKTLMK